ncbi:MAG: hypothetical protein U0840_27650 [Gemmataceae bacterium]
MATLHTPPSRIGLLALVPLALVATGAGTGSDRPRSVGADSPTRSTALVRTVDLIEPGTVIGKTAPQGWTHLVLKSHPRLPDDQKRLVNDLTADLAVMVFTTMTARVEPRGEGKARQYRLAGLGVGVGVRINDRDVVVSPETQVRLGANLGLLARQVLGEVYLRLKTLRVVATGPTSAIVDTPGFMPRGKRHAPVVLRYVFLVDGATGRLDTLVWRIDTDGRGGYDGSEGMIEWLPPNKLVDAEMQVDLSEFRLGIPSERAFAVRRIPAGKRQFSIPEALRPAAGMARLSSDQAGKLVGGLRELIQTAGEADSR